MDKAIEYIRKLLKDDIRYDSNGDGDLRQSYMEDLIVIRRFLAEDVKNG
jgi:hypothetical protein